MTSKTVLLCALAIYRACKQATAHQRRDKYSQSFFHSYTRIGDDELLTHSGSFSPRRERKKEGMRKIELNFVREINDRKSIRLQTPDALKKEA